MWFLSKLVKINVLLDESLVLQMLSLHNFFAIEGTGRTFHHCIAGCNRCVLVATVK